MSQNYVTNDGFKPLPLPEKGEDLQQGRQYMLDPVARGAIEDMYGMAGVPAIIECLLAKRPATRIDSTSTNLETGEVRISQPIFLPCQHETFRAFQAHKRHLKFTIDLARVHEMRPFYAKAHKVSNRAPAQAREKVSKVLDLSMFRL